MAAEPVKIGYEFADRIGDIGWQPKAMRPPGITSKSYKTEDRKCYIIITRSRIGIPAQYGLALKRSIRYGGNCSDEIYGIENIPGIKIFYIGESVNACFDAIQAYNDNGHDQRRLFLDGFIPIF